MSCINLLHSLLLTQYSNFQAKELTAKAGKNQFARLYREYRTILHIEGAALDDLGGG